MALPLKKETANYHSRLICNILERCVIYYIFTREDRIWFVVLYPRESSGALMYGCLIRIRLQKFEVWLGTGVVLLCSWARYFYWLEWKSILVKFQVWGPITCSIIASRQSTAIILVVANGNQCNESHYRVKCHSSHHRIANFFAVCSLEWVSLITFHSRIVRGSTLCQ